MCLFCINLLKIVDHAYAVLRFSKLFLGYSTCYLKFIWKYALSVGTVHFKLLLKKSTVSHVHFLLCCWTLKSYPVSMFVFFAIYVCFVVLYFMNKELLMGRAE